MMVCTALMEFLPAAATAVQTAVHNRITPLAAEGLADLRLLPGEVVGVFRLHF